MTSPSFHYHRWGQGVTSIDYFPVIDTFASCKMVVIFKVAVPRNGLTGTTALGSSHNFIGFVLFSFKILCEIAS